jgi:hypothetical protein
MEIEKVDELFQLGFSRESNPMPMETFQHCQRLALNEISGMESTPISQRAV